MNILDILRTAMEKETSDIFLVAGLPVTYKVRGHQFREGDRLLPDAIDEIVGQIYQVSGRDRKLVDQGMDDDFSFAVRDMGRFRVNVFRQRGSLAAGFLIRLRWAFQKRSFPLQKRKRDWS